MPDFKPEPCLLDNRELQYLSRFEMKDEGGHPLSLAELPAFKALQGEKFSEMVIQYLDTHTGASSWAVVKSTPIFDERGHVQLAVNIFSDITEQKELEQRKSAENFCALLSSERYRGKAIFRAWYWLIYLQSDH